MATKSSAAPSKSSATPSKSSSAISAAISTTIPSAISSNRQQLQPTEAYKSVSTNTLRTAKASDSISDTGDEQQLLVNTNISCKPSFHIANIQNLITKTVFGEIITFLKAQEKISFLREQCTEETPYFLGFAETYLKEGIQEAEFQIEGYSHVTSHRINRDGGGVIVYTNNNLTYQTLVSASDEMCSIVGIYINEIRLVVFMVYRPPPSYNNKYHGEILEKSFQDIVLSNIFRVMNEYKSQIPVIIFLEISTFLKLSGVMG